MVHYKTIMKINIHEAKANLSKFLAELAEGETLIICKRNTPIAEVRRLPELAVTPRPIGLGRGAFTVPDSFFEPLPDELQRAFEGTGS
jgi:antitoxin (DNA-binding transcriptional repressor) of toxin-antitoxin stability system